MIALSSNTNRSWSTKAQATINLNDIRKRFHTEKLTEKHLTFLIESIDAGNSNTMKAYKGVYQTLLTNYHIRPEEKYLRFMEGKKNIEQAITDSPNDLEIRYLRLMVQLNASFVMSYHSSIEEDLQHIHHLCRGATLSTTWKKTFINQLLTAQHLTNAQRVDLLQLKIQLQWKNHS